jgi:hypothetical protein
VSVILYAFQCKNYADAGTRLIQEDGIFNFSGTNLISHGLLLQNHFAAALGASHTLGFDANDIAAASLDPWARSASPGR